MSLQRALVILTTLFYLTQAKPFFFRSSTPPTTTEKVPTHTYHIIQIPVLTLPSPYGYHTQNAPSAIGYRTPNAPSAIGYHTPNAHSATGYQTIPSSASGGWENSLTTGEGGWELFNDMEDNFDEKDMEQHYHTYDVTNGNTFLSPVAYGAAPSTNGFIWPTGTVTGGHGHNTGQASPNNPDQNKGVFRINSFGLPQYYPLQPNSSVLPASSQKIQEPEESSQAVLPTPSQVIRESEEPAQPNDFLGRIRDFLSGLVNRVSSASKLPQPGTTSR